MAKVLCLRRELHVCCCSENQKDFTFKINVFSKNISVLSLRTSPHLPLWKFQFNFRLKKMAFENHPYPLSEIMDTPIHTYPIILNFLTKILIAKRNP